MGGQGRLGTPVQVIRALIVSMLIFRIDGCLYMHQQPAMHYYVLHCLTFAEESQRDIKLFPATQG